MNDISWISKPKSLADGIEGLNVFDVSMDKPEDWPRLYRAHSRTDSYDGEYPRSSIWFATYAVLSYTPCGVWIDQGAQKPKFVNLKCERMWATLTKREALYSMYRRKIQYLRILNSRKTCAEVNFDHLEELLSIGAKNED